MFPSGWDTQHFREPVGKNDLQNLLLRIVNHHFSVQMIQLIQFGWDQFWLYFITL
jgi:hypothetical protein